MTAIPCRSMRSFAWNAGWAILTPSAFASSLRATMQRFLFAEETVSGPFYTMLNCGSMKFANSVL